MDLEIRLGAQFSVCNGEEVFSSERKALNA